MLWLREVVQFEVTQRYARLCFTFHQPDSGVFASKGNFCWRNERTRNVDSEEMNERETLTHFKWSAVTGYPEALPPLSSESARRLPSKVPQLVSVPREDRRPGSSPAPPNPPAMPPLRAVRQLFHPSFPLAPAAAPRASLSPAFWSLSHSQAPPSRPAWLFKLFSTLFKLQSS